MDLVVGVGCILPFLKLTKYLISINAVIIAMLRKTHSKETNLPFGSYKAVRCPAVSHHCSRILTDSSSLTFHYITSFH